MLMPPFELHHPTSVAEAVELASSLMANGEAFDWVAGGTDVLPNYKWHINPKPHVISLAGIEEAHRISKDEIGCMVTLDTLTEENGVHPLLAQAAAKVASSLIRKSATVGGNLCLDTRCFWYNQGEDWRRSIEWCHKADCGTGADCRVIPNQNTLCVATYQGDLAPNFMVLGASVVLMGPNGERTLPLNEFYELDGMKKNVMQEGEFLLKVVLGAGRKACRLVSETPRTGFLGFPRSRDCCLVDSRSTRESQNRQHCVGIHPAAPRGRGQGPFGC